MEHQPAPTVSLPLTVKERATALYRLPTPDGGVAHAEFVLGNTRIYTYDESKQWQAFAMPEGTVASCLFTQVIEADSSEEMARRVRAFFGLPS